VYFKAGWAAGRPGNRHRIGLSGWARSVTARLFRTDGHAGVVFWERRRGGRHQRIFRGGAEPGRLASPVYAVDIREERLNNVRGTHAQIKSDIHVEYVLNADLRRKDKRLAALPPGAVVINATGLGKDRPGSPITDPGVFPQNGLVWELNYRGALKFLRQARQQEQRHTLTIGDG